MFKKTHTIACAILLLTVSQSGWSDAIDQDQPQGDHDDHMMLMDTNRMPTQGLLGPYPLTRESSGTSWQPDSATMAMGHFQRGEWSLMSMATANIAYSDAQARERGDNETFVESMAMLTAQREVAGGVFGAHTALSFDPMLIGKQGYPLLFQTGETADGKTPLIDRQHPHDLFMELAASYSAPLDESSSIFFYLGLPGEPALGPTSYMHRASGMDNPEAPIAHHWLDSTHISFGVATAGIVVDQVKLEASVFNGREPDEHRYNIETQSLDSWSARATINPAENWSLQASFGRLKSPEQLEPGVDVDRTILSATYNRPLRHGSWQSMLAIGRNTQHSGVRTEAYLIESALTISRNFTFFARAERVDKNELFEDGTFANRIFTIDKLSIGGVQDFATTASGRFGLGVTYNLHSIPNAIQSAYGSSPDSWLIFLR